MRVAAIVCAVAVLLGGCTFTEEYVSLDYAAGEAEASAPPGATVEVVGNDARVADRGKIAMKINGYGMETAPIRARQDVVEFIADSLEAELRARGYEIGPGGATVAVDVARFFNAFKVGLVSGTATAEVALDVAVKDAAGTIVHERAVRTRHVNDGLLLASGSNAKETLEMALAAAMADLLSDQAFLDGVRAASVPAAEDGGAERPVS